MFLEGFIRRFQPKSSGDERLRQTINESLAVAMVEGDGDEMTRAGARYHIKSSAATGIAPVQALPTTAAQWLLYNPVENAKSIYIDAIGVWLVSGTAGAGGTLLMGICGPANVPATKPQALATGIVLANSNPVSGNTSRLVVASGQTLAASPGWAPIAFMNPAGTVLGQTQMEQRDIKGRIILPPGTGLALAVISPTGTTPLFAPYGTFRELVSDPE